MNRGKNFLSLTTKNIVSMKTSELLDIINANLKSASIFSLEYAHSIASSIVCKVFLIKNKNYNKFYDLITRREFRNNKYIHKALTKDRYNGFRTFLNIYKDEDRRDLLDSIFLDNGDLFDELILVGSYNLDDIFSYEISNNFRYDTYRRLLNYILKGRDKKRVVRALLRRKNNEYIYVVSKMNDMVLKRFDDDNNYLDAVISLLKYEDYRHLIWNYYNKFIKNKKNEEVLRSYKYDDIEVDELKELLGYTFYLMNNLYTSNRNISIVYDIDILIKNNMDRRDRVHTLVFGEDGYRKIKNNSFDLNIDFKDIDNEEDLFNLKRAFYRVIYGVSYEQAVSLVINFDKIVSENSDVKEDKLIYETILAMKNLYDLDVSDKDEIRLFREIYFKYVNKKGIYTPVDIEGMVIMEGLMRKLSDVSVEKI